jgi:hypothetical protein
MKKLLYFAAPFLLIVVVRQPWVIWFLMGFPVLYLVLRHKVRKLRLKKRIEPVIIGADFPSVKVPDHLDGILILVPRGREERTRDHLLEALRKAENDMAVKGKFPSKVILPNDGQHVNESSFQYAERLIEEANLFRAQYHQGIKENQSEWYLRYHHKQERSYEWGKD